MLSFACDYLEGAHEAVLRALCETNSEQSAGYGYDAHCEHAADMIRERCGAPDAAVHFFVGGTQVNMTAIAAALRPHEGALCADSGHINVHESDAFLKAGVPMLFDSPTNQQFPILTREQAARLSENFGFSAWRNVDENRRAVRFCTSWATTDEQLDELIRAIENL